MSFKKWYSTMDSMELIVPAFQPIWGNTSLNIPFTNNLYTNNIIFVHDLFDAEGVPRTKESLEISIGKNIMFTTYQAIWRAMPKTWKDQLKNFNLVFPPILVWLFKDKKGTRNTRTIWSMRNVNNIPIGQQKWSLELNNPQQLNWKQIYSIPKKCNLNARIIYFQYQISHRSLITNKKLHQFGLRDNANCELCNIPETIQHLLIDCPYAQGIWNEILGWLNQTLNSTIHFNTKYILLGNSSNEIVTNCIILIVKHELYKRKWNKNNLTLAGLPGLLSWDHSWQTSKGNWQMVIYLHLLAKVLNRHHAIITSQKL